jgi:hypothetical protein
MMEKLLGLPVLASEHGKDVDNLIIYVHWLMIVLFVGWIAYFVYVLIRSGNRERQADYVGVKNHASNYIEGGVAGRGHIVDWLRRSSLGQGGRQVPTKTTQRLSA